MVKLFATWLLEEERTTLKSTLDVDLNLSQHLMSTSQVNISCQHLMSIFQLDFPFLMPSISQYLEFNIYDCYFWVGFPVSAVKYFSKFGILHLRLHFELDFPFPLLGISQNWKSAFMIKKEYLLRLKVLHFKSNQKSLNPIHFWGQEVNIWAAAGDHGGVASH